MVQLINPLAAVNEGQQFVDGLFTQRANKQAGQALQQGNYNQAAGALFGNGDLRGGMGVQQYGQEQQAAQQAQTNAQKAQQLQATLQIVGTVKRARDQGQDVSQILPQYRDAFIAMGTDPQQLAQIEQQVAANPAFLDQIENIVGQQARQLEIQNLGNGYGVAIDKATGAVVNEYQAPQRPVNVGNVLIDPSTREVILDAREPKYQTIQNTDGSSSVVAIDQPEVSTTPRGGSNVDVLGAIESVIPGVTFNSGLRTPEQNRGAGGADRSYHLRGQAVDIPPQQGTTPEQLKSQLRAQGVDVRELINEGDHWHIAWGNDQKAPNFGRGETRQTGTRVVAQGENRGLSPAQQRAEATASRAERRQDQAEENSNRRDEVNLRREFNNRQEVKDFRTVQSAYNSVQAAARNPSAAGDLSLIFAYMKILDPGSVVREQEFANAQNAAGVPDRIRNLYNRALNGQRLNPNQRNDFLNQANNLFQTRQQTYRGIENEYRGYAESYGVSPDRVAPTQGGQSQRQRSGNTPGVRFDLTPAQQQARQRVIGSGGRPSERLGSTRNPYYINPADVTASFANVPRGGYFITPDGQVRGPKP